MVNDSDKGYKPGPDFDEDNRVPILPISLSDSTELWLIQWPIDQLQPADFHGKELSLKLHKDGKLASFENSSGKSYEVVSYAAQKPNATVFLPCSSDSKVVGKISRRVCLVRYPEPGEFDKPTLSNPNLSGLRLEGSRMKTLSHLSTIHRHGSQPGTDRSSRETLTSGHSIGQGILETPQQQSRKKKHNTPASASTRSIGRSSLASKPESQMTSIATGSAQSNGVKKSKKRKIKVEE